MPTRRNAELAPADAAEAVTDAIASNPASPVVLHWQLSDFPSDVAKALGGSGNRIVWAYGSFERGEKAEAALKQAGLRVTRHLGRNEAVAKVTGIPTRYLNEDVAPFEQPRVDAKADRARRERLTAVQEMRLVALSNLADGPVPQVGLGEVLLISIGMLSQSRVLSEVASWDCKVVVLDHLTSLQARWIDGASNDGGDSAHIAIRPKDKHVPHMLLSHSIPQVYLLRDESACRLIAAYLQGAGVAVEEFRTKFRPNERLVVTTVATELVRSAYDGPTFLSISISAEAREQLVGQGVFGALTPDSLSMSGDTPLHRATLKVGHPRPEETEAMLMQLKGTQREYIELRARDHVRTTMLAFDSTEARPELVILADHDLSRVVTNLAGGEEIRLTRWPFSRRVTPSALSPGGSEFLHRVLGAMIGQLDNVSDGRRYGRIIKLLKEEQENSTVKKLARRLARLAHGLSKIVTDADIDLSARYEDTIDRSHNGTKVVRLFSRLMDDLFPWSPTDRSAGAQAMLDARRYVLSAYRVYRRPKI